MDIHTYCVSGRQIQTEYPKEKFHKTKPKQLPYVYKQTGNFENFSDGSTSQNIEKSNDNQEQNL